MALDKATLITDIKTLIQGLFNAPATMTPAQAQDQFAQGLADALDKYVKTADGIYQAGKLTAGATVVTSVGGLPAIKLQ